MDNAKHVSDELAEGNSRYIQKTLEKTSLVRIYVCAASPKAFSITDIKTAQTKRLSFSLARRRSLHQHFHRGIRYAGRTSCVKNKVEVLYP